VPKGSSTPMDWTLARLHETMAKITTKRTACVIVKLCDHATSLLRGIASNIHHLYFARVNEFMHSWMVFCQLDDSFQNSINYMKD
jgi:hypothetical protein